MKFNVGDKVLFFYEGLIENRFIKVEIISADTHKGLYTAKDIDVPEEYKHLSGTYDYYYSWIEEHGTLVEDQLEFEF